MIHVEVATFVSLAHLKIVMIISLESRRLILVKDDVGIFLFRKVSA